MKVYQAINAVQRELAATGITKDRRNQQQGYNFRGIDDVYNTISPLLAKNGLCILPRILTRGVVERETAKGGVLFYVTVEAEFDFVSSEDGSSHTVRTFGEAMDSGDKATNKAMSAAYKYAAFQAFAIPTEGDNDADATTHDVKPKITPVRAAMGEVPDERKAVIGRTAVYIAEHLAKGDDDGAYDAAEEFDDHDEKLYLWSLLDSKQRAALKDVSKRRNTKEAA